VNAIRCSSDEAIPTCSLNAANENTEGSVASRFQIITIR
jgi:hypothetical protein